MNDGIKRKIEIVAPAGNLASLKAAADNGADSVYAGFNDPTNARNFEGLNFSLEDLEEGKGYLQKLGKKLFLAINTFPQKDEIHKWQKSVDNAVKIGADALIMADIGVLSYARERHPDINIHLSVQASASNYESINFYKKHFGIKRVILPRVLSVEEIKRIKDNTDVELEAFVLGGLCINIEGRCYLSSFITGASTNSEGACSPSRFVRFVNGPGGTLSITLNGVILNELKKGELSPYPTCCKGRYLLPDGRFFYAMEEPESLNALSLLPNLIDAGVTAFKIEGRQRTKSYVATMTAAVKEAMDSYSKNPASYGVKSDWRETLLASFEGGSFTTGSYTEK